MVTARKNQGVKGKIQLGVVVLSVTWLIILVDGAQLVFILTPDAAGGGGAQLLQFEFPMFAVISSTGPPLRTTNAATSVPASSKVRVTKALGLLGVFIADRSRPSEKR